jgi:hypothetical protein
LAEARLGTYNYHRISIVLLVGSKLRLHIVFDSDERTHVSDFVEQELTSQGHEVEFYRHRRAREVGAPVEGAKGRV